jgi:hypothetical protein
VSEQERMYVCVREKGKFGGGVEVATSIFLSDLSPLNPILLAYLKDDCARLDRHNHGRAWPLRCWMLALIANSSASVSVSAGGWCRRSMS